MARALHHFVVVVVVLLFFFFLAMITLAKSMDINYIIIPLLCHFTI